MTDTEGDHMISLTNEKFHIIRGFDYHPVFAQQDYVGFGWLTKPTDNPWSETTRKQPAC